MLKSPGVGEARAHHGEILQGVFEDEARHRHRGLVSFPCRHLKSEAVFFPTASNGIEVVPGGREKALKAAKLAFARAGVEKPSGYLVITSDIPVGRGLGSSTADVLAAIHAVLDHLGLVWAHEEIMRIAVDAETACDSTLFTQSAVLFAQREGIVLEPFHRPLPPLDIISIDTQPAATVSTLDFEPARYDVFEAEAFKSLRSLVRRAIRLDDVALLGRVATASAKLNERFLPKPRFHDLVQIAARSGAVGVQVAHSGTMVGIMVDHRASDAPVQIERATAMLNSAGFEFRVFDA